MALIYCRNCGNQISDRAPSCPHCGAVVSVVQQPEPIIYGEAPLKTKKHTALKCLAVVGVIMLISLIFYILSGNKTVGERQSSSSELYNVQLTVAVDQSGPDEFWRGDYNVDVYVDNDCLGSVSVGNTNTFSFNTYEGEHTVTFKKSNKPSHYRTCDIDIHSDYSYSCTLVCKNTTWAGDNGIEIVSFS